MQDNGYESRVFRIDRFVVPAVAEVEFLSAVTETNIAFDGMEGCLQRHMLKQQDTPGDNTYITIVEWASLAAIQAARQVVAAKHKQMNLDPQKLFQRLNIKAELGHFVPVVPRTT